MHSMGITLLTIYVTICASVEASSPENAVDGIFTPDWLYHKIMTMMKQQTPPTPSAASKRVLCQEWHDVENGHAPCFANITKVDSSFTKQVTIHAEHADPIIGCPVLVPKGFKVVIHPTSMPDDNDDEMPLIYFATGDSCSHMTAKTGAYPLHKFYTSPLNSDFNVVFFRPTSRINTFKIFIEYITSIQVTYNYAEHDLEFN